MRSFKSYFMESEQRMEAKDLRDTLSRLPKSHQKLLKDYTFKTQPTNTLKGDNEHVGSNDLKNEKIVVASAWRYGKEFCMLHEVGHTVWFKLMTDELKHQWEEILKNTKMKSKDRQSKEEMFAMAYAATYSARPPECYRHKEWIKFIKKLPS